MENDNEVVVNKITLNGGKTVDQTDLATFIVLMTPYDDKYPLEKCVTSCYIDCCLKQNQLNLPSSSMLFVPYPPLLNKITFSISQYAGDHRTFVKTLVE